MPVLTAVLCKYASVGRSSRLSAVALRRRNELRDFLRRIDDRLNGVGRVVNDPLRACRHGDAERQERECDAFLHGVPFVMMSLVGGNMPPITRKDLPRSDERAVYDVHNVQ